MSLNPVSFLLNQAFSLPLILPSPHLNPLFPIPQDHKKAENFISNLETHFGANELPYLKEALLTMLTEQSHTFREATRKSNGYVTRLFSGESWKDWLESRTALGTVALNLADFLERNTRIESAFHKLDKSILLKANEEAHNLLNEFESESIIPNFWERISNVWEQMKKTATAIDQKITSWMPLPPSASAEVISADPCGLIVQTLPTENGVIKCEGQHCAKMIEIYGKEVIERMIKYTGTAAYRECKRTMKIDKTFAQYTQEYEQEKRRFDAAKKEFPVKGGHWVVDPIFKSPERESVYMLVEKKGKKKCLEREHLTPGYIRWEIRHDGWFSNPTKAEGTLNYNVKNGEPTVSKNDKLNNNCTPK